MNVVLASVLLVNVVIVHVVLTNFVITNVVLFKPMLRNVLPKNCILGKSVTHCDHFRLGFFVKSDLTGPFLKKKDPVGDGAYR